MCFIFTCGETEFKKQLQDYNGVLCQCHNCGNYSAHAIKRNPWFTFCFIPVVPLSIHGYEDVVCSICHFSQPIEHRKNDLEQARHAQGGGGIPMQPHGGPPQGWGGARPSGGPGPGPGQAPMHYK